MLGDVIIEECECAHPEICCSFEIHHIHKWSDMQIHTTIKTNEDKSATVIGNFKDVSGKRNADLSMQ